MDDDLERLYELDNEARLLRAHELVGWHNERAGEASRIRKEALLRLVDDGRSPAELSRILKVSQSRVGQLLSSGPRAERALLGTGALTVAIGGKWEAGKTEQRANAVVSREALAAYHLLQETARDCKLDATHEVVPPPGMVRLNRDNLIVIGSPRILPLVGQVLEADEHLGFESGAQGWYLIDRASGQDYRSPSDSGDAADYAYVGRLPRPDGRGTFLYIAGIHAMGTLGAAQYVTNNLAELYQNVRTGRWSTLIATNYDPDSNEIVSTDRISPLYRGREGGRS